MTIFKEVHTKEVQKGIVKSAQRKKISKSYVHCVQIKSLGFTFITYTSDTIAHIGLMDSYLAGNEQTQ